MKHLRVRRRADLLTLDLAASVIARLDDASAVKTSANATEGADSDDDESEASAGPLTLAIDVAGGDERAQPDSVVDTAPA